MAKGDQKRTQKTIQNQQTTQTGQQNQIYGEMFPNYVNSRADDQRTRGEIEEGFRNFNPKYNADDYLGKANAAYPIGGSGGGGGGSSSGGGGGPINLVGISGGIDPNMITNMGTDPYAGYKKMSEGLRPEFWADFQKYMGGFDESTKNLGQSADSYRGFVNTGGFSDMDLQNIRSRAMAPTEGIFKGAQDQMMTQAARSGLNQTGLLGANQQRMAIEANRAIGDQARGTEADIAERVQAGKLAGTAGLAGVGVSQGQIAQMQTSARTQVEQLDQQMRAQGLGGMTDIEKARLSAHLTNQQITQAGQIATNQGILGKAQIQAQNRATSSGSSAASAALAQRQREFEAGFRFDTDQATNRDLLGKQNSWTNLYGTTPGATQITGNQLLQGQNQFANQNLGLIDRQINASQMPGDYDIALGRIGNTVNLAGSVMSLGQRRYNNQNPNQGGYGDRGQFGTGRYGGDTETGEYY